MQITINSKFFGTVLGVATKQVVETAKVVSPLVKQSAALAAMNSASFVADNAKTAANKMTGVSNKLEAMIAKQAAEMVEKYSK